MLAAHNVPDPDFDTMPLAFNLLGQVALYKDGQPLTQFRSQKEPALLIYLAHTGKSHGRDAMAELLWSGRSAQQARSNLRTVLARLRKQVGDFLVVTRKSLALTSEGRQDVDSARLVPALARIDQIDSAETAHALDTALQAYGGPFLAGFHLPDAPLFEAWMVATREQIHKQVIAAYHKLAQYAFTEDEVANGLVIARRWLHVDGLDEAAHTFLIRTLLKDGRVGEAVAHYDVCIALLHSELGIAPPAAMTALIQDARRQTTFHQSPRTGQRHNLPRMHDQFFGRVHVRQEIHTRLDQPWCRLVTIVGPGGAGKTRLALTVARERLQRYTDGAWQVELADIDPDDPDVAEAIAVEIATAMGLRLSGSARPVEQLLTYLQDKQQLLLLDNFAPQLGGGVRLVLDLIQRCEAVQLIVTAREAMNLRAEWTIALNGLQYPNSDTDESPSEAVELFMSRRAQHQWQELSADDLAAVRQICRLVEGMPLAIELAASLTDSASLREIADQLRRGFTNLTSSLRDAPPRHRSLQTVVEMSLRTLSPGLQLSLARLSVFRGGFTEIAAQRMPGADVHNLATLCAKSLVSYDETAARYQLHPMVRDFAVAQLPPDDLAPQAHADYYLGLLAQHTEPLQKDRPQRSIAVLHPEIENIRYAWNTGLAQHQVVALYDALISLSTYYQLQGLALEGEAVMRTTVNAARTWGPMGVPLAARAGLELARFQNRLGQPRDVIRILKASLDRAKQCEDPWGEGMAHVLWGEALWRLGEYDAARNELNYAFQIAQALGDARLTGWSHHQLGIIDDIQGRYEAADYHFQEACTMWRAIEDAHALSNSLNRIGLVHYHQVDLPAAQIALEEALALCNYTNNCHLQALLLNNLGMTALEQGNQDSAQEYLQRALALAIDDGNLTGRVEILVNLGRNYRSLGEIDLAIQCLEDGLQIAQTLGNRLLLAAAQLHLAGAVQEQQDWGRAEELYTQTLALAQQSNMKSILCETLLAFANLLKERDATRARTLGSQALSLARDLNLPTFLSLANDLNRTLHFSSGTT